MSPTAAALAAFVLYLLAIVALGVGCARFSSTGLSEFFLAGRGLRGFVVALSTVVSGRSAWLIVGASGMAFSMGAAAVWAIPGYVVAELLLFLTVAPRLRRITAERGDLTVPDFFASSFPARARSLRCTAVLFIVLFFVVYVAAQFEAGAKVMGAAFPELGLDHTGWVLLTASVVLAYTVLGGCLAVSLTDVVQASFMVLALVVLPAVAILGMGGPDAMLDALFRQDPTLLDPFAAGAASILGLLAIGLGSPGNPHILVRYMAVRDPDQLRASAVVGTVWNVLMGWGAIFAGLIGRALFVTADALPAGDPENLFAHLADTHLAPFLYGLVLASIFAAIMSTADSQLLVASSAVVRDFGQGVLGRGAGSDPRRDVRASRWTTAGMVVAALVLLAGMSDLVFWFVLFAWGGLGAAFGPALLLTLYGRRVTGTGVLAGFWVGAITVILWKQLGWHAQVVYELVPAFPAAFLAIVLVSRWTRR